MVKKIFFLILFLFVIAIILVVYSNNSFANEKNNNLFLIDILDRTDTHLIFKIFYRERNMTITTRLYIPDIKRGMVNINEDGKKISVIKAYVEKGARKDFEKEGGKGDYDYICSYDLGKHLLDHDLSDQEKMIIDQLIMILGKIGLNKKILSEEDEKFLKELSIDDLIH